MHTEPLFQFYLDVKRIYVFTIESTFLKMQQTGHKMQCFSNFFSNYVKQLKAFEQKGHKSLFLTNLCFLSLKWTQLAPVAMPE